MTWVRMPPGVWHLSVRVHDVAVERGRPVKTHECACGRRGRISEGPEDSPRGEACGACSAIARKG